MYFTYRLLSHTSSQDFFFALTKKPSFPNSNVILLEDIVTERRLRMAGHDLRLPNT